MTGVRLEVETHIVEGSAPFIKNLTKVINQAGVHIEDFVFAPLAAAMSVLDKRQKELGVVLVDMGAGTTGLVVWEEKIMLHTAVLPIGSSHITSDIAIGLRTDIDVAEAIKIQHGNALVEETTSDEMVVIENQGHEQETVSRQEVSNIISARIDEIFAFIDRELKKIGRSGLLPAGVILTGGGAHLPGVVELGKKRLRLPVRVGKPQIMPGISDKTEDPAFAVAIGLILWAVEQERRPTSKSSISMPDIGGAATKVKGWLRTFLP